MMMSAGDVARAAARAVVGSSPGGIHTTADFPPRRALSRYITEHQPSGGPCAKIRVTAAPAFQFSACLALRNGLPGRETSSPGDRGKAMLPAAQSARA